LEHSASASRSHFRAWGGASQRLFTALIGLAIFSAAFLYVLPQATDLIDDHFMHVAWGRQLLYGRMPVLDMEEFGLPLQSLLSAGAERLIGYRLLSEGVVVASAYGIGAVITFLLARTASGSLWLGASAAILQVAIAPRTYSYPKIVVYAAGIFLVWRYLDSPSSRRAGALGAAVAAAFYLRHDHGLYLGVVTTVMLALQHSSDWKRCAQRVAIFAGVSLVLVLPFLAYVHHHVGVVAYVKDLRALAVREHQQNRFDSWPEWPFTSAGDVIQTRFGPPSATIGVRWNAGASDEARRAAAARYGLRLDEDEPVESGRFLLTNVSTNNVLALLNDPIIEDTSQVDRRTGHVPVQGLWAGRMRLLAGLDAPYASAGFLFYGVIAVLAGSALALSSRVPHGRLAVQSERLKVAAVVLVGAVTALGLIREPLAARMQDVVVAPLILAAWWSGKWWLTVRSATTLRSRVLGVIAAAVIVVPVVRAIIVVGGVPTRLDRWEPLSVVWQRLVISPPIEAWHVEGPKFQAARYVRSCTAPGEPLLVLWFAPDLYYYSDRPFAGRLAFYLEGYWASDAAERQNISTIERDRPAIALMESDRERTDLYTYPRLLRYLAESYHLVGTIPSNDDRSIEVFARNDRAPTATEGESGWPCYR
jgi:hypothetical protein